MCENQVGNWIFAYTCIPLFVPVVSRATPARLDPTTCHSKRNGTLDEIQSLDKSVPTLLRLRYTDFFRAKILSATGNSQIIQHARSTGPFLNSVQSNQLQIRRFSLQLGKRSNEEAVADSVS